MLVEPFELAYLPQLRELVNQHLSAVVPGWALTDEALAEHLERDPGEYVTDPWVRERETLCVTEGWRVHAAAHLLRYGDGPEVGEAFRGAGEISWLLALPERRAQASAVLSAAHDRLSAWRVDCAEVCSGLPVPIFGGVPDSWPHVVAALEEAGYRAGDEHREAVYGGNLNGVHAPGDPPIRGLRVRRAVGTFGVRFSAMRGDVELGRCECVPDLTRGGALYALRGWAELAELWVREGWRGRRIGGWLACHAAAWMRLAGCDRVVISVAAEDEAAGAGRFYRRLGWNVFTRQTRSWQR